MCLKLPVFTTNIILENKHTYVMHVQGLYLIVNRRVCDHQQILKSNRSYVYIFNAH